MPDESSAFFNDDEVARRLVRNLRRRYLRYMRVIQDENQRTGKTRSIKSFRSWLDGRTLEKTYKITGYGARGLIARQVLSNAALGREKSSEHPVSRQLLRLISKYLSRYKPTFNIVAHRSMSNSTAYNEQASIWFFARNSKKGTK